ncbi:MAG: hypothetical protein AAGA81_14770 [Acidobacteriota bacterium]
MNDRSFRRQHTVEAAEEKALQRLLHGELRGPEARQLRERLDREPALARRYAELEASWSALGESLPVPPTPDVESAVRARLGETDRAPALWDTAYGGLLAAAMLLVGAGLGWWAQDLWTASGAAPQEPAVVVAQTPTADETVESSTPPSIRQPTPTEPPRAAAPVERVEEPAAAAPRLASTTRPLDEDFEVWSATLGDEPEWNDELFSSSVDELLAEAESPRQVEGWDVTLADGWGLPSTSMAAAYLGLEDAAGGD